MRNRGPVVTYGVNDMVLDNWGTVDRWTAEQKLTSYRPSGIGFINFNVVNTRKVLAPIEPFGRGSRGFNVYAGTVHLAEFERVTTSADGSVDIQISQPIGRLVVHRGVETFGGTEYWLAEAVPCAREFPGRLLLGRQPARSWLNPPASADATLSVARIRCV